MVNQELEEGQLVLCTVDKIIGTTVFVKLEGNKEGTITTSEIAPGRIRNLRDYVVPGKKIVSKILSIRDNKFQLSLRRVNLNEKKEFLQKVEKEKSNKAILKTVLGEEAEKIIENITSEYIILNFFEEIKKDPKLLEKFIKKEEAEKIIKILESKKEKPKEIRQIFQLSNKSPDGIIIVKDIIGNSCKGEKCNVSYIAAGKYRLSLIGENFKSLKNEMNKILESVEKQSKKQYCEFSIEKG